MFLSGILTGNNVGVETAIWKFFHTLLNYFCLAKKKI